MVEVTAKLAQLISTIDFDALPPSTVQKTKEILGDNTCWKIIVLANPRIEVNSDTCRVMEALKVLASKASAKIPKGMESLEVEYQEYAVIKKEIGGKH